MAQGGIISAALPVEVPTTNDIHSGLYDIQSTDTITVEARKQMVIFEELILDGTLVVNGKLYVRA